MRSVLFIISFVRPARLFLALAGCVSGPSMGTPPSLSLAEAQSTLLDDERLKIFFAARGIPMPNDLRMMIPGRSIPAHLARYSGAFIGEFAGGGGTWAIVFERIYADGTADLIEARASSPYVGPTVYPRVKVTFKDGRFRGALRSAIWQYWFEEGSANLRVETNVAPAVRSNFTGMIFVGIFTKVPE